VYSVNRWAKKTQERGIQIQHCTCSVGADAFCPTIYILEKGPLYRLAAQAYSLDKVQDYRHRLETGRLGVPFYVRDLPKFERSHPKGSRDR
jgi:hypothetical protein